MLFAPGIPRTGSSTLRHHRRLRQGLCFPAQEVLRLVDSELGFPAAPLPFPLRSRLYLFLGAGGSVLGCLEAQPLRQVRERSIRDRLIRDRSVID
ncbi:hypothetical protein DUI87_28929 [Hirundo rustica rustica]|uniref:Uncharacterized protein n=1 Tax=Hirundo rustica rustica TaxID=333673 RepID=A0A3M0J176_HIRRU|nr:hypothetical protein DUI87_28929 [Hirundo rustica rustica]